MDVSIVVTCYNEEKNIARCLESLLAQRYNAGNYEIVVSDGGSWDATQSIVKSFCEEFPAVRLEVEPKRGTAAGRNSGIRAARHDVVAFIDADCEAPPDWLALLAGNYCTERQRHGEIAAVGGRNICPHDGNAFMRALEIALDSYLGSFNSIQGRQFRKPTFVPSLATVNALYDRKKIASVGYFDETLGSEAEDADLNYRLSAAGYKLLFVPESFVYHRMRPTPRFWMKNMFRYGKGRARLLKRHPAMRGDRAFMLPLLFVIAMAVVPLGCLWRIGLAPLAYFPFIVLFALLQCISKKSISLFPAVAAVYVIQHFSYAAGELYGLLNRKVR